MCSHGDTIPPTLGFPAITRFITHLPGCYLQRALLFPSVLEPSLFYNPFPSSQPFSFLLQYLQSPKVNITAWGPRGNNLVHKSGQCRSRSFQGSRTIPRPHQELPSSQLSQVQEDCQQYYCTEAAMNTVLWESGGATVSGAALWPSASLGGLEKTLEHTTKPTTHLDSMPSVPSHCGRVQRSESCFLFYCNLPLSSPKISKGTI